MAYIGIDFLTGIRPRPKLVSENAVQQMCDKWSSTITRVNRNGARLAASAQRRAQAHLARGVLHALDGPRAWIPEYNAINNAHLGLVSKTRAEAFAAQVGERTVKSLAVEAAAQRARESERHAHNLLARQQRMHLIPPFRVREQVRCLLCSFTNAHGSLSSFKGTYPRSLAPGFDDFFDLKWSSAMPNFHLPVRHTLPLVTLLL